MPEKVIKLEKYGASKDYLLAPELAFSIPVMVGNTGVVADANGRKIIKNGTPIGSSVNVLTNRSTVLQVTNTSALGSNTQGLLLATGGDIDVTDGEVSTTLLVFGFVDSSKLNDIGIVEEAKTALTKITFVNGGAY